MLSIYGVCNLIMHSDAMMTSRLVGPVELETSIQIVDERQLYLIIQCGGGFKGWWSLWKTLVQLRMGNTLQKLYLHFCLVQ